MALDRSDVDLRNGILAVRQSKFGKSRFVPVTESTCAALADYAKRRDELCSRRRSKAFLVSERGARLQGYTCPSHIRHNVLHVGLRPATGTRRVGRGPRLQDFRHCFATRKLDGMVSRRPGCRDGNCRNSQLTSVTWISPILTGISRLFRNSSNWPRSALLRRQPGGKR